MSSVRPRVCMHAHMEESSVRVCVRVYTCLRGRIVTLETSDASRFLFAPHRTFSHGSPHCSLRGSNASRQSVFYCVHAQEASIINLDHDLLPSAYDPPLFLFRLSVSPFARRVSLPILRQKGTVRRETAFTPLRAARISANRPHTVVFHPAIPDTTDLR